MEDKFKLYKKWFWVGIAVGFLNLLAGLVYGIVLALEKEHRKEGLIVVVWSILVFIFLLYVIAPALPGW